MTKLPWPVAISIEPPSEDGTFRAKIWTEYPLQIGVPPPEWFGASYTDTFLPGIPLSHVYYTLVSGLARSIPTKIHH